MMQKKYLNFFLFFFIIITLTFLNKNYLNLFEKKKEKIIEFKELVETPLNSNVSLDVRYVSSDVKGNTYIVNAKKGEVDLNHSDVIFLTEVEAFIKLNTAEIIKINADFGKYNIINYDTIFSKKVSVNYLDNNITAEYLDFSLERNSMIISKDVIYNNLKNVIYADVAEINLENKDTKIFMYSKNEKVIIKNK